MRERLWEYLANIKFKALYACDCSKKADKYGRLYSLFVALASTGGSIATWAIWKEIPSAWAIIVATSQGLHIAKPYFPFIKNDKIYLEMSYDYEALYLELEKLWYSLENESITIEDAEKRFYKLREQELKIDKSHKGAHCPEFKKWIKKIAESTYVALRINFPQGE